MSFFFSIKFVFEGKKMRVLLPGFFFFLSVFGLKERTDLWGSDEEKQKQKKEDAETDGVGGRCEENSIWCQTRNSRRLFSFRVELDGVRGGKCGGMEEERGQRVCLSVCEQLRHLATTKILNWERMTWGKPNVAPRGVVTACVSSSSRLFQVLGSVPGPAPRCSPANRMGWDQTDRTLELLRFRLRENYTVPLSVSEGRRR